MSNFIDRPMQRSSCITPISNNYSQTLSLLTKQTAYRPIFHQTPGMVPTAIRQFRRRLHHGDSRVRAGRALSVCHP